MYDAAVHVCGVGYAIQVCRSTMRKGGKNLENS